MKLPLCVLLAGFSVAVGYADPPGAHVIRNARVVPVSGPVLASGTVVVRNGLIEAVGANVVAPADAWVIEGNGLTVYPGLIDALSTWGIPEANAARPGAAAPPAAPAPRARGPEDRPSMLTTLRAADLVQPNERRAAAARSAGFTTAVTFPTRGIFAGQGAAVNLAGATAGQMVVASPVGTYVTMQTGGFGSFPGSLMGVIAYIRQVHIDKEHYVQARQWYERDPKGKNRPEYDKAIEGLAESPRLLLPAVSTVEIDRMVAFGPELKTPYVLYGAHDGYLRAAELKRAGVPVLVSLKWPEAPREPDPESEESLRTLQRRDRAPSTPAALQQAGVTFGLYSDGLATPADVKRAVRRAIAAGLPHDEAVRAMTLNAARIYGLDNRLGSLEAGKVANLVVTRGNLFDENAKVEHIFVDGVKFEPAVEAPAPGGERRNTR